MKDAVFILSNFDQISLKKCPTDQIFTKYRDLLSSWTHDPVDFFLKKFFRKRSNHKK